MICKICGVEQPSEQFRFLTNQNGIVTKLKTCIDCERKKAREYYREKKKKTKKWRMQ